MLWGIQATALTLTQCREELLNCYHPLSPFPLLTQERTIQEAASAHRPPLTSQKTHTHQNGTTVCVLQDPTTHMNCLIGQQQQLSHLGISILSSMSSEVTLCLRCFDREEPSLQNQPLYFCILSFLNPFFTSFCGRCVCMCVPFSQETNLTESKRYSHHRTWCRQKE